MRSLQKYKKLVQTKLQCENFCCRNGDMVRATMYNFIQCLKLAILLAQGKLKYVLGQLCFQMVAQLASKIIKLKQHIFNTQEKCMFSNCVNYQYVIAIEVSVMSDQLAVQMLGIRTRLVYKTKAGLEYSEQGQ